MRPNIASEVAFGESAEERILSRWLKLSAFAEGHSGYLHSPDFKDFDFYVHDRDGFVIAYCEVKRRRTPWGQYPDVIFPIRKHKRAKTASLKHSMPFIGVTEYGCGTLVEINLAKAPSGKKMIARRDRPGTPAVEHAIYSLRQLTVLEAA